MLRTLSLFAVLLTSAASAQEAGKPRAIDFTSTLHDLDGHEIKMPVVVHDKTGKDLQVDSPTLTLSDVAVGALDTPLEDDRGMSGADKFKLDELARRVYKQRAVVLTAEDIATIKQRIGKAYGQMIVGIAYRLLDPASAASK